MKNKTCLSRCKDWDRRRKSITYAIQHFTLLTNASHLTQSINFCLLISKWHGIPRSYKYWQGFTFYTCWHFNDWIGLTLFPNRTRLAFKFQRLTKSKKFSSKYNCCLYYLIASEEDILLTFTTYFTKKITDRKEILTII